VAGVVARAAHAARAPAIASKSGRLGEKGGFKAVLLPEKRKLAIEAAVILALIALGAGLAYHFNVKHIHNPRPLGGVNVDVTPVEGSQSQAAFAIDPANPRLLLGVDDNVTSNVSTDGGRTWHRVDYNALNGTGCTHRDPKVAVDASGREYVAYVASDLCSDELTPHLVVATRARLGAPWHATRVAKPTWEYGFDDAPAIAVAGKRVVVAWTRSLGPHAEAVVVAASTDDGRTWTAPAVVDAPTARSHSATVAVADDGTVYVGGIDVPRGIWAARSSDGARTFTQPVRLAPLAFNPAAQECGHTGVTPVANEARTCAGPYPTLLAVPGGVDVVYSDFAADRAQDVLLVAADASLKTRFHATVNPTDTAKSQQVIPAATVDVTTGALWACWYDTLFDPSGDEVWFTCSHSRDGRSWYPPVRASAVPTTLDYLYGTYGKGGLQPDVVADGGVAHAFWIDSRRLNLLNDIYTATLR
jgi:hypothetical protein